MFLIYSKNLEAAGNYDVVVCGGGVAGFCAAVQAARAGARTALVEKYGMLGGILTVGGNPEIGLFYAGNDRIISGIGWELVESLAAEGWADIPEFAAGIRHSKQNVSVNITAAAAAMDEMCREAGVTLRLHEQICDAVAEDGFVRAVVIAGKEGLRTITGACFVDATGDGDLSAYAGADFHLGEEGSGELQPGTLRFYWNPGMKSQITGQMREAFITANKEGKVQRSDFWPGGPPDTIFTANGNNINHVSLNGASSESRTAAETAARKSVMRLASWAREQDSRLRPEVIAPETASRESRRVVCDHYITVEEYVNAVDYNDAVCYSYYPIDLHQQGEKTLKNIFLAEGAVPKIPLSALRVSGFNNLLVAGRCVSGDRLAHSAFRVKASCMAMGQAAGAAAALSLKSGGDTKNIVFAELKKLLKKNGAIVPELK